MMSEDGRNGVGSPSGSVGADGEPIVSPQSMRRSSQGSVFNPMPHEVPAYGESCACPNPVLLDSVPASRDRLVIAMVGLPGRGKTFVARRIANYLSFFHGVAVENLNVADVLRSITGGRPTRAAMFDPSNEESLALLTRARARAIEDTIRFLDSGTQFSKAVIVDGLNSNVAQRQWIIDGLRHKGCTVLFIESVLTDDDKLEHNIREICSTLPDYAMLSPDDALADYRARVVLCERVAQPIDDDGSEAHLSWIRIRDFRRYEVNNVHGFLQGRVVQLVMNLTDATHEFYLTRHGQSEYNKLGKIGGDAPLTDDGRMYARRLAEFAKKVICRNAHGDAVPARLWTSGLRRTKETAAFIEHPTLEVCLPPPLGKLQWVQMRAREWRHLDEIYAGICDGMTYDEIQQLYPEEFELRHADKLGYRYPRGESYLDVCHRLEPVILEMERCRQPLLIIAHQGILRLIYAYFCGIERAKAPHVSIPLNTVIQLQPCTYSCVETRELLHTKFAPNADGQGARAPPMPPAARARARSRARAPASSSAARHARPSPLPGARSGATTSSRPGWTRPRDEEDGPQPGAMSTTARSARRAPLLPNVHDGPCGRAAVPRVQGPAMDRGAAVTLTLRWKV